MSPTSKTLGLLGGWASLSLGLCFLDAAQGRLSLALPVLQADAALMLWVCSGLGLSLTLCWDALRARRAPQLQAERRLQSPLALGVPSEVRLHVHNLSPRNVRLRLHDLVPETLEASGLPCVLELKPNHWVEQGYRVLPIARGEPRFGCIQLRVASPWGLWWRHLEAGEVTRVRVYPDFRILGRTHWLANPEQQQLRGAVVKPRRGEGTEFHQLREHRPGDVLRQIDWAATSRFRRLVSREYRDEQDQQVVFLLDCSRRLHTRDGLYTHLDHALNAVLLCAYAALRHGDAVGLLSVGSEERFAPPRKGQAQLNQLLNLAYDLTSAPRASDLAAAMTRALARLQRRSLIVFVTNVGDEHHSEWLAALRLAQRRHLVLVASLREPGLSPALRESPEDFDQALRHAGCWEYLNARNHAHRRLTDAGALCLDVEPTTLAPDLLHRYLSIKASRML